MQEGLIYEDLIRAKAEFAYFTNIKPIVLQSTENELFMASLDCMDKEGNIYEFKYSNNEFDFIKDNKKPSDKYYTQVQF